MRGKLTQLTLKATIHTVEVTVRLLFLVFLAMKHCILHWSVKKRKNNRKERSFSLKTKLKFKQGKNRTTCLLTRTCKDL